MTPYSEVEVTIAGGCETFLQLDNRVVLSGATLHNVQLADPVTQITVSSGGVVTDCELHSAFVVVSSGGALSNTTLLYGYLNAGNNCSIYNTTVGNDWYGCSGAEYRHRATSGALVSNLQLDPHGTAILTFSGADIANCTLTENGGAYITRVAGSNNSTLAVPVFFPNTFNIPSSAGTPYMTTVHRNTMVSSGFLTSGAIVQLWGGSIHKVDVQSGAVISAVGGMIGMGNRRLGLIVSGGMVKVLSGAQTIINSAQIEADGVLSAVSGASVNIHAAFVGTLLDEDHGLMPEGIGCGGGRLVVSAGVIDKCYMWSDNADVKLTDVDITSMLYAGFGRATIAGSGTIRDITIYNGDVTVHYPMEISAYGGDKYGFGSLTYVTAGGGSQILWPPQSTVVV